MLTMRTLSSAVSFERVIFSFRAKLTALTLTVIGMNCCIECIASNTITHNNFTYIWYRTS